MNIPRPEYPRPQFVRPIWQNLNGEWNFEIDHGKSGKARKFFERPSLDGKITVPFCPESELSGVNNKDFMECVWYKKKIQHPFSPKMNAGDRTILHIGACDYITDLYVNGKYVGNHIGGYIAFSFDITDFLTDGENDITICATDNLRSGNQPYGKQCYNYYSEGCSYTRTTGIWQTVWLEAVPAAYIKNTKYTPFPESKKLVIEAECKNAHGKTVMATVSYQAEFVAKACGTVIGDRASFEVNFDGDIKLWSIESPNLYDLTLTLENDTAESYFGMRSVAYDAQKHRFYINGKSVFMRLILDQGFYPDGIYTASCEDELINDIKRSMAMGFNGARLHEKIFEPRFLYHCDKMGYIVWGEHANWGLDLARPTAWQGFLPEWIEALKRDYNHPAIIGWCPTNETQHNQNPYLIETIYHTTKAYDPYRPVIDCSGWTHQLTDILDAHDYTQNPAEFAEHYLPEKISSPDLSFVSEYGGIWWRPEDPSNGWGYGNRPASPEEFIERYKGLTEALLSNGALCGFCYTQLTDVEQEVNGLYTYHRVPKFAPEIIYTINIQKAAAEQE